MFDPDWQIPAFNETNFRPKSSRYAIIIPVINEGERIQNQLRRMRDIALEWDVFVVDGGSTDGSMDLDFLRSHHVRKLLVKTGPGRLSAQLRLGLAVAMAEGYEGTILIDGNDKDEPLEISRFIVALDQGYDHVQGSRFIAGGKAIRNPVSRRVAIRMIHAPLISLASGFHYTDTTNGFRAYSRKFLLDSRVQPFRETFSRYELHYYLAVRAGQLRFRVLEVPVTRTYPPDGSVPTKISFFKGNTEVLKTLFKACIGAYHPQDRSHG